MVTKAPPAWQAGEPLQQRLNACPTCDLLVARIANDKRHKGRCPRCRTVLYHHNPQTAQWLLACAIGGLFLFWPAIAQPLVVLNALGQQEQASILATVAAVWRGGYWDVALWVGLFAILIPLLRLLLMLVSGFSALRGRPNRWATFALRSSQLMTEWGMGEIYLLGVLVALVKLSDLARVEVGLGLMSLAGLIALTTIMEWATAHETLWRRLEGDGDHATTG